MATKISGPEDVKEFLNRPDIVKLIETGDLEGAMDQYGKTYMAKHPEVQRELERQQDETLAEIETRLQAKVYDSVRSSLKSNGPQYTSGATKHGAAYNKTAPGAALDGKYTDLAEFMQANWHHRDQGIRQDRAEALYSKRNESLRIQNSFSSTIPDAGGALIPEEMRSDLLQVALETSVVRPNATVIPMSSLTLDIPAVDDTSHASSVLGGIVGYWTAEAAAATESQASFGRVRLEANKLTIYCEAPNELVADAVAFGAFLDQQLPRGIAFYEDLAFLTGNGAGVPLGALSSGNTALIATTRTTSSKIKAGDIVNLYTRMLPTSINSAVWVCSPDVVGQLLQLTMPTGDATTTQVAPPLWLNNQQLIGGPSMQLLGRPLYVSEKVSALGTKGDLSFVDFKQYLIGDRQAVMVTSSPHFKFSSDKTAFKLTERCDGRPWMSSALTPANGSANTLSAYVTVAT